MCCLIYSSILCHLVITRCKLSHVVIFRVKFDLIFQCNKHSGVSTVMPFICHFALTDPIRYVILKCVVSLLIPMRFLEYI